MRKRITYANVAATLALVFSMTGGAIAANHYLINSTKQINPKVLKKLKGKTGATGKAGATGAAGVAGAAGAAGAAGKEGPRGPGLIATGSTESSESCTLTGGEKFCFAPETAFTASANGVCQVSVQAQIESTGSGKPTTDGPYFRIAIKENGSERNDEDYGYYFMGTTGGESITQTRVKLIPVQAGTSYNFGAFYGNISGEWTGKPAPFEVAFVCYGS